MSYPAKVILFGEYTLLNGSSALAIPYFSLAGSFEYGAQKEDEVDSHHSLKSFLIWLCEQHLLGLSINAELINKAIQKKIWFNSSIPLGAGLGSSGALVAAVATVFSNLKKGFTLQEQWKVLAKMESYFHGTSSGIDPLVSFTQKAIRIKQGNVEVIQNVNANDFSFELIPSENRVSTSDLVAMYKVKLKKRSYLKAIEKNLIPIVNQLVDATPTPSTYHLVQKLSEIQTELFPEMLGKQGLSLALDGKLSSRFAIKLCGSGGGFLLKFRNPIAH